ncbi:RecB family exonuclease [Mycobacterium neglectum]|uniref:RecB family exonuclease n=1 Tax=Mycobacterium neglectum TaxID=242737 RepID=UPI000BFF1870|nr:PD-(D/E)XK nuclease family protein [Mycobacterium neglectum]
MRSDIAADVNIDFGDAHDWLSPTRAWRLTECAASVGPVVNKPITSVGSAPNAGTVAHRAVQLWIDAAGYRNGNPQSRLSEAINEALAEFSGRPTGEWPPTRARLLARASQLAERLLWGDDVHAERELLDPIRRLRGTPDIVLMKPREAVVIDLKTPTSKDDSLQPWIIFQLTIYAHLVEQVHGILPAQVEVFRLNRGFLPLSMNSTSVEAALETVERAREADASVATPAPATCRYCRRRLDCQAHWDAAVCWPDTDCVEGTIERVERAANGIAAVFLASSLGSRWVSGVPGDLVTADVGERIRLVRLRRSDSNDDSAFKWSRRSALAVLPLAIPV